MTRLSDVQLYWRSSQVLRGFREGYPVVAEGLLDLVARTVDKDSHLASLARDNSLSRFQPAKPCHVCPLRRA